MSFGKNIKEQGFTIVELLIVVVVIAILAAITIVSYNGITNQANQGASKAAAATVQKKAELYFADASVYPTAAQLTATADTAKAHYLPISALTGATGATLGVTPVSKETGKSKVQYAICNAGTGANIVYWTYGAADGPGTGTGDTRTITLGTCS